MKPYSKPVRPLADRFWEKVDKRGPEECWNWTAYVHNVGYGQIGLGRAGEGVCFAHRVSYMLAHGDIPAGKLVLHKCDNRLCVNPAHLWLGSHRDNTQDMIGKGRRRTHEQVARGEAITLAKLTEDTVRAMRRETGLTMKQLGEKYHVSTATAHKAYVGQTWKHVT